MTLDYVQESYYWIPRIGDKAVLDPPPIWRPYQPTPAGGWVWATDLTDPLPNAPGVTYNHLGLAADFPRKMFISRIVLFAAAALPPPPNNLIDFEVLVDPGAVAFNSGTPVGAEVGSNFTKARVLVIKFFQTQFCDWDRDINPPIVFDRDAGDKIEVTIGTSVDLAWLGVAFHYLVPAASQS